MVCSAGEPEKESENDAHFEGGTMKESDVISIRWLESLLKCTQATLSYEGRMQRANIDGLRTKGASVVNRALPPELVVILPF